MTHSAAIATRPRPTPDLLEAIVAATRHAVNSSQRARPRATVEREALRRQPEGHRFRARLRSDEQICVIAECKRRSPSRGVLCADYDPAQIARRYAEAGAAAISVLTEPAFFDGRLLHLSAVRDAVTVPLLRKDFLITEYQLLEARAAGADAILLIVAALDDAELRRLLETASSLDLATLVEVHDDDEMSRALDAGAGIIGINNRNLRTLEVNLDASRSLIARIPESAVAVAESGIRTGHDIADLRHVGFDAFLVGESLMTEPEPGDALDELLRATAPGPRGGRGR